MWGGVKVGRCGAGVTVGQDYGVGVGGGTAVRWGAMWSCQVIAWFPFFLDQKEEASFCKRQLPG
jgi:hypothetical protein